MKKSIGKKTTVLFMLFSLILFLALTVFTYYASWNSYSDIYADDARSAASMVAALVDGDRIASYLEGTEKDAYYRELEEKLSLTKRELQLMYLYIFVPGSDSFTYILDVKLDTDDPAMISDLGDVFDYTYIEYEYLLPDVQAQRASSQKVISRNAAGFGQVVSAWAPIFAGDGHLAAMVEVDIALTQVEEKMREFLLASILISASILVPSTAILLMLMRRMVVRPLKTLADSALSFAAGEKLAAFTYGIQTDDEIQALYDAFGKMTEDIDRYTKHLASVTADRERIATELDVATKIQASMLPCIFPAFPGREEMDIYATMLPAKEVGGDFYDFFLIDDNTLAVVMADVSGKGVPAALFMVIAKTLIKNNAQSGKSPQEVFETVNDMLCENNEAGMFVTAFMGYVDLRSGTLTYVNAGHNPPLLKTADQDYRFLKSKPSLILASFEGVVYREERVHLSAGDILYLYTDGVTEAMNRYGRLFSEERLLKTANTCKAYPIKEQLPFIKKEIDVFADGAEQADDITMLALHYHGVNPTE